MDTPENEYLKSIDKSLRILAEEAKAMKRTKTLGFKNGYTEDDVIKEVVLFFILGIFVGCMPFLLGTDLLK